MRNPRFEHAFFPLVANSLASGALALGLAGCVIHVDSGSGGSGGATSTSTSTAGGSGGDTFSTGGTGGSTVSVACSPAPDPGVAGVPIPGMVTADFALPGGRSWLSTAPDGDAVVVTAGANELYARRLHAGQWAEVERIANPTSDLAVASDAIAVATGGAGRALVVYGEWQSPYVAVCARRFEPGSGWTAPELIGVGTEGWWQDPSAPPVAAAMRANGESMVVWPRTPEKDSHLHARRAAAGEAFGEAELVSDTPAVFGRPALAFHDDGRAIVAWHDNLYTSARAFEPGSGWGDHQTLGDFGWAIALAKAAQGETVAVWGRASGDGVVMSAVAGADGTFDTAELIDGYSGDPHLLSLAGDGTGLLAFSITGPMCERVGSVELRDEAGVFLPSQDPIPGAGEFGTNPTGVAAADGGKAAIAWDFVDADTCMSAQPSVSWVDPSAGAWQSLELDSVGYSGHVGFVQGGQILAVWSRFEEDLTLVRAVDPSAP